MTNEERFKFLKEYKNFRENWVTINHAFLVYDYDDWDEGGRFKFSVYIPTKANIAIERHPKNCKFDELPIWCKEIYFSAEKAVNERDHLKL